MTGGSSSAAVTRDREPDTRAGTAKHRRPWWLWAVMALVLLVALTLGTRPDSTPSTNEERSHALADSLKCPTCRSQSVADSDAPVSKEIRSDINRRIESGESDAEIRAFLAAQFGEDVLLTPSAEGVTGLVWVIPVVALVAATAALAFAFRRWREVSPTEVTEADRELVDRIRQEPV